MKKLLISALALFMMLNIAYAKKGSMDMSAFDMDKISKQINIQIKDFKMDGYKVRGSVPEWSVNIENLTQLLVYRPLDFVLNPVTGIEIFFNVLETDNLNQYICPLNPNGEGGNHEPEAFWTKTNIDLSDPNVVVPCGVDCKMTTLYWDGYGPQQLLGPGQNYVPSEDDTLKPAGWYPLKFRFQRGSDAQLMHPATLKVTDISPVPGTDITVFTTHNGDIVKIDPVNGDFENQYPSVQNPSKIKAKLKEDVAHAAIFISVKGQPLSASFIAMNVRKTPNPENPDEPSIEGLKLGDGMLLNFPYRFGNDMAPNVRPGFSNNAKCYDPSTGKSAKSAKSKKSRKGAAIKRGTEYMEPCSGEYILKEGLYTVRAIYIISNLAYEKSVNFKVEYITPDNPVDPDATLFHWDSPAPHLITIDPENNNFVNTTPLVLHASIDERARVNDNTLYIRLAGGTTNTCNPGGAPTLFGLPYLDQENGDPVPMEYSFPPMIQGRPIKDVLGDCLPVMTKYFEADGGRYVLLPGNYELGLSYSGIPATPELPNPPAPSEESKQMLGFEVKPFPPFIGVKENKADNITLFPNPVKDVLTIKADNNQGGTVKVFDMSGRQVTDAVTLRPSVSSVNLSHLSTGQYIVIIDTGNGKVSKKITKQ